MPCPLMIEAVDPGDLCELFDGFSFFGRDLVNLAFTHDGPTQLKPSKGSLDWRPMRLLYGPALPRGGLLSGCYLLVQCLVVRVLHLGNRRTRRMSRTRLLWPYKVNHKGEGDEDRRKNRHSLWIDIHAAITSPWLWKRLKLP